MFQEKEIMEYRSHKAPEELKNHIWSSIEHEKRKLRIQRQKWIATAACFATILFAGNFIYQSTAMVKMNNVPISYLSVQVEENIENTPALAMQGKNKSIQENVPLELQVREDALIRVTKGNLRMELESDAETSDIMEMGISKESVVYWYLGDETEALCIITTEGKEYHYVMEKEEAGWKVRLEKTE